MATRSISRPQRTRISRASKKTPGVLFTPREEVVEFSFDDPLRNLQTGEDLQSVAVAARKNREGATNPTLTFELMHPDRGVFSKPVEAPVPSTGRQVLSGTWDAGTLGPHSGEGVQGRLKSYNGKGNTKVELAGVHWRPVYSEVVGISATISWDVRKNVASDPANIRWNVEKFRPQLIPRGDLIPSGELVPNYGLVPKDVLAPTDELVPIG